MTDLIDRAALLEKRVPKEKTSNLVCQMVMLRDVLDAPAVDAVEVVRRKDCKHWNKDALACDNLPWVDSSEHANWYETDFCSYGERRTDGNTERC